jgi:hypothetical protein
VVVVGAKYRDITGQKFGYLTAIRPARKEKNGATIWECKCVCGNKTYAHISALTSGQHKSCGCRLTSVMYSRDHGYNIDDYIGVKFNRLTILRYWGTTPKGAKKVLCKCECGRQTIAVFSRVKSGETKSCGCLREERKIKAKTTHGMSNSPTYETWASMKARCNNQNAANYYNYGGKGIRVCDRWNNSFESFVEDMGEKPIGFSIDRINPFGNYEPTNCRWATPKQQARNRTNNVFVKFRDKVYLEADFVNKFHISHGCVQDILKAGKYKGEDILVVGGKYDNVNSFGSTGR